jgi:hypothetical protein
VTLTILNNGSTNSHIGSETWNVQRKHETNIHAAEMEYLLGVARYTCTDHQQNTKIRKKLNVLS